MVDAGGRGPLAPRPGHVPERVGERALALFRDSLVWDNTMPWMSNTNSPQIDEILPRWHSVGVNYVSVTVDFRVPLERSLAQIAATRRQARERSPWLTIATTTTAIRAAQAEGRLALGFNLQDTLPYGSSLDNVELLADLGVRQAVLAYNNRNFVGDGCAEPDDAGLSIFGTALVAEMNRVGVLVDGSHAGRRTTFEAMAICASSGSPFVFSHANPDAVRPHYRNITDDQMRACAETGGVIGINGVGYWCGDDDASTEAIFRCLDHTVELVGAEHVGLAFDYIHDLDSIISVVRANPIVWPAYRGEWMWKHNFAGAEQMPDLVQVMLDHGYPDDAIVGILGANWERVANRVWHGT